MPRQKFCSVPGCLSTTELVKREQESFLAATCAQCKVRRPCRCPAPDIYTTRKETRTKFTTWCTAIGLKDPGYYINVCYRHFSKGCPTRMCPNPDVVTAVLPPSVLSSRDDEIKRPPKKLLKKTKVKHIDRSISTGSTSSSSSSSSSSYSLSSPAPSQALPPHLSKFLSSLMQQHNDNNNILNNNNNNNNNNFLSMTFPCDLPKTPLAPSDLQIKPEKIENLSYQLTVHPRLEPERLLLISQQPTAAAAAVVKLEEMALMDMSEDPCLNDGHFLTSFADEQDHVQKWLDICESA